MANNVNYIQSSGVEKSSRTKVLQLSKSDKYTSQPPGRCYASRPRTELTIARISGDTTKHTGSSLEAASDIAHGRSVSPFRNFDLHHISSPVANSRSLSFQKFDSSESRAIQFYFERTVPSLRQFNSAARYLFEYFVPQVSHSEAAIRHQIVAAASLQELRLNASNRPRLASTLYYVHYGRALKLLGAMEASSKLHVMLISCLLFVAMENIRNVPQQAYLHLQHGLQILQRWKRSQSCCELSTSANDMIASLVEPMFAQLEAAASMVGMSGIKAMGSLQWQFPIIPDTFQTLSDAREKFFELGQWLYFHSKHLRSLDCFTVGNDPDINALWKVWYRRFSDLANNISADDTRQYLQSRLLYVHYHTHVISLRCQQSPYEHIWDWHISELRDHLAVCYEVCHSEETYKTNEDLSSIDFDFTPGVLPPLWQICVSCRDPVLRRQALDLLRLHHYRCGHTDDCSAVVHAEAIMRLEEDGINEIRTCHDVPEIRRVRPLEADLTRPGVLILTYSRAPYASRETITVPYVSKTPAPVLPFKLWPVGEAMRLAGYQGMIRPRTHICQCKSYGAQ